MLFKFDLCALYSVRHTHTHAHTHTHTHTYTDTHSHLDVTNKPTAVSKQVGRQRGNLCKELSEGPVHNFSCFFGLLCEISEWVLWKPSLQYCLWRPSQEIMGWSIREQVSRCYTSFAFMCDDLLLWLSVPIWGVSGCQLFWFLSCFHYFVKGHIKRKEGESKRERERGERDI